MPVVRNPQVQWGANAQVTVNGGDTERSAISARVRASFTGTIGMELPGWQRHRTGTTAGTVMPRISNVAVPWLRVSPSVRGQEASSQHAFAHALDALGYV